MSDLASRLLSLEDKDLSALRLMWRNQLGGTFPKHLPRWLLMKVLAYRLQVHGDLDGKVLKQFQKNKTQPARAGKHAPVSQGQVLTPGTILVREWKNRPERVMVLESGFEWNDKNWRSLSQVARAITGTSWNGHRFFGLRQKEQGAVR